MSNTKVCTKCSLEKPLDEYHKQGTSKDGLQSHCKLCRSAHAKEYNEKNKGRFSERKSEYFKEYYRKNKERLNANTKAWKRCNPEALRRHSTKSWSKRRAAKLHADVPWADQEKIDYVYYCRDLVNKVYGGDCEVDHIEPLQGKHVCGLHVHNNLQLLSAKANRSKGARRNE